MIRKIGAAAAAAMLMAAGTASAQIADGGFETQGASAGSSYCYLNPSSAPLCGLGAWVGAGAGFVNEANGDWPGQATDGTYHAFVQGAGIFGQFFSVATSGAYVLNWSDAGRTRGGFDGNHTYNVLLDTAQIGTGTTTNATGFTAKTSSVFSLNAGQTYALIYQGIDSGADTTSFIDNVALQAVPEPESWALLIGGLGIVGMAVRRRRREGTLATA